jgi:hypothetical protein
MSLISGLFRSRDKSTNSTNGSSYRFLFGGSNSGKNVNERSAMQMTAVYACVRILSESIAGLPVHLYQYVDSGSKRRPSSMVQREMAKRSKGKKYHSGVHAFSTKIKCGECGSWYGSKVWHSNSKYRKTIWQCNHKFDGDCRCQTPHLTDEEIQLHFLSAANKLLATKVAVIANGREMQALLFDTTELETEQAQLLEETQVVSDMVQQAIQKNARTALNQTEYQKRYDSLVQRFDRAKSRLEEITAEIQEKQTASANMDAFLTAFEQMPDALTEFSLESWHSMGEFATIYSTADIRFTFKNGQKIQA